MVGRWAEEEEKKLHVQPKANSNCTLVASSLKCALVIAHREGSAPASQGPLQVPLSLPHSLPTPSPY